MQIYGKENKNQIIIDIYYYIKRENFTMAKTIKDSDLLRAMEMHLDYDSVVYGANGHYSVGGYYNLNENYTDCDDTEAAKMYKDSIKDEFKDAHWMKEI